MFKGIPPIYLRVPQEFETFVKDQITSSLENKTLIWNIISNLIHLKKTSYINPYYD